VEISGPIRFHLGRRFEKIRYAGYSGGLEVPGTEGTAGGVWDGLCKELIAAQRRLYDSYVAQVSSTDPKPNETDFKLWCREDTGAGIRTLSGWQFRKSGKHRWGGAIDIDAGDNP
jgi:hypothetical protein